VPTWPAQLSRWRCWGREGFEGAGPSGASTSEVSTGSRLIILGCCLLAAAALTPQVVGELALAHGLTLAGPLPSPGVVTAFTRAHALLLASMDPERASFEPEPWPAVRIVYRLVELAKAPLRRRSGLEVEERVASILVRDRPLRTMERHLATLAVARHLAETWSTVQQLDFLREHEWFGPCGASVDGASRRCFQVDPSRLSDFELARLIRRARGGPPGCRFATGEPLVAVAVGRGWMVAEGRSELRVPDCEQLVTSSEPRDD